ncbi:hypothetical protein JCM8202_005615 [Rhodotorula sphaerocarpa]
MQRPTHPLRSRADHSVNTEQYIDLAKAHNNFAVDEPKELEKLNRSIFRLIFKNCPLAPGEFDDLTDAKTAAGDGGGGIRTDGHRA